MAEPDGANRRKYVRFNMDLSVKYRLIALDPTDSGAWQFLSSIYASEGRKADAERAQSLYLRWRDDPRAYDIALRFFAAHPQWGDERVGAHVHSEHSAKRSIVTGAHAAPDR